MINKQTKIVATISGENCEVEFIKKLHSQGVDVVRLNTAHQTTAESDKVVANVRQASERLAILVDTKGPEMRTLPFAEGVNLPVKSGDKVRLKGASSGQSSTRSVLINYPKLYHKVPLGASVLIDDGDIALEVKSKKGDHLICEALNDGVIKGKKSVNLPGVELNLPSLSAKDKDFIDWAIKAKVDFIAHSFVRNAADVLAIQKALDRHKSPIKIIAKIENRTGLDNIDKILDHAYGVMVARGDMGVEIPAEEVPMAQKELIKKCVLRGKPIITATQMLHSMINNPRPTRAEVSDIANAILDGTDALMLSGETAYGRYPEQAVKMMSKIALKFDRVKAEVFNSQIRPEKKEVDYLAKLAVKAADELKAKEIIMNDAGDGAVETIASYRPTVPVFVKCSDKARVRALALSYGVYAHHLEAKEFGPGLLRSVIKKLTAKGKLEQKDLVIYLKSDTGEDGDLTLEICRVGKVI